ncbi:MAG TPA: ADP-ribosylglycohydrolase family protein [Thermodesulfobacteriota bacterium]|nr:ADP-ribosylglycohydrolase family protein [Thermodesulfobacteriota bacterium]
MLNLLSREILQDKFRGAVLGCFLGDAFGSGFEGMTPGQAQFHIGNLSKAFTRRYTDDTDMTLALAESIIQCGRIDPEDTARHFSLHCDLTRGYAAGTIHAVLALRAGLKWHEVAKLVFEDGSFGNGAAMRVSPIGLFYHQDLAALQEAAVKQASITHVHRLGQWGAVMQACAVGLAVTQSPKEVFEKEAVIVHLREVLWGGPIEYVKALNKVEEMVALGQKLGAQEVVQALGNGVEAHLSVPSACYLALTYSSDFCDAVRAAISLGGDTDTIAGMVGAVVGALVGEKRLPAEWIEQLEEGPRGRSFARDLADRLFEKWCKIHQTSSGQPNPA